MNPTRRFALFGAGAEGVVAGAIGRELTHDDAVGQSRPLMGTDVPQRVEMATHIEDRDLAPAGVRTARPSSSTAQPASVAPATASP